MLDRLIEKVIERMAIDIETKKKLKARRIYGIPAQGAIINLQGVPIPYQIYYPPSNFGNKKIEKRRINIKII